MDGSARYRDAQQTPTSPSKQVRFSNMPTSPPAYQDFYAGQALTPSRIATANAPNESPRSPLLKKFAPIQDRRVNTILLEALQLVEFTKEELSVVEKAVKRLRDAIHGFAILVDKQVNIIGTESLEERGRVKADIQDLCENLKTSNALLDSTCARMKKHLSVGKNQVHTHKRKLIGRAATELVDATAESCNAHQCSVKEEGSASSRLPSSRQSKSRALYGVSIPSPSGSQPTSPSRPVTNCGSSSPRRELSSSPVLMSRAYSPTKVPLTAVLEPTGASSLDYEPHESQVYLSPEFFASVADAVGVSEKEFFEPRDIVRFVHEMLTFAIARSGVLTFMGKAHHRQLIPKYAHEIVRLLLLELQPPSQVGDHTLNAWREEE